jgi:UDP:flavonoid glycosyltransferase YjiC (YdhE family)
VKVLVTCVPQAGHMNPMVPLISAFIRAGDEVVVATGDALRDQVETLGARFERAGNGLDAWFGQLAARTRGVPGDGLPSERIAHYFVPRLFGEIASADMVDDVLAAGERLNPDLVLFDAEAFVGPLAAHLLRARQANHLFGPMPAADVSQLAADALSPLWRSFGRDIPPDAGLYDGVTVAVCPPSLDPERPPRGERVPLRPAPLPLRPPRRLSPPVVYFSLGTLWANAAVVASVLDGLSDLPVRVVATLGSLDASEVRTVPPNVELHQYLPQAEVLPDASLVVHHAGAGTMFGALAHGLPQLALPQAADNFINADRLAQSGAAVVLHPHELTPQAVAAAVTDLLADDAAGQTARAIAEEITTMPTAEEVATRLRT